MPLLEIGNATELEVVADDLSQEAVKIDPGVGVLVSGYGGESFEGSDGALRGSVRWGEPSGFTRVSALGVEEQRVFVIIDPSELIEEGTRQTVR